MRPIIVVGLGGSGGWHALAWAAEEAAGTGGRLVLCHACRPESALAGRGSAPPIGLLELADPALARAVATVRTRLGGDRVGLRIQPGRPGLLLVDAAADADCAVVGPPSGHGWAGSTAHHVAAHAPCPVVVVHPTRSAPQTSFAGHVVVGVDGSAAGRAALEFGFGYADLHNRALAAVHVTDDRREDLWYDESTLSTHFTTEPAGLSMLAFEVEPWMRKYPAVSTKRAIFAGQPLPGLLRAGAGAQLLVVGDRGRSTAVRTLLGSVSDGVVDTAGCPVAVVHDYERRGAP